MPTAHHFADEQTRQPWPAWGLSVALHCVLFVTLGLVLRAAPKSLPGEKTADRSVGIVLAPQTPEINKKYFSEESSRPASSAASAAAGSPSAAPAETAEAPLLPNIALPSRADVSLADPNSRDLTGQPGLRVSGVRKPVFAGVGDDAILAADVVRNKPAGPNGPAGRVSLFGSPTAEGHSFVFVIDRSNSMGDGGLGVLSAAEVELQKALAGLLPTHKFQIVAYNQKCAYFSESSLADATEANRKAVRAFFTSMGAIGSTEHEQALLSALKFKPDVIFLFTDGDPNLNAAQIERIVSRAGGTTTFHMLQFGRGPLQEKDNFMMRLADRTRGSYGYVDMNQARRSP